VMLSLCISSLIFMILSNSPAFPFIGHPLNT
jgi:hypothetical protein